MGSYRMNDISCFCLQSKLNYTDKVLDEGKVGWNAVNNTCLSKRINKQGTESISVRATRQRIARYIHTSFSN